MDEVIRKHESMNELLKERKNVDLTEGKKKDKPDHDSFCDISLDIPKSFTKR